MGSLLSSRGSRKTERQVSPDGQYAKMGWIIRFPFNICSYWPSSGRWDLGCEWEFAAGSHPWTSSAKPSQCRTNSGVEGETEPNSRRCTMSSLSLVQAIPCMSIHNQSFTLWPAWMAAMATQESCKVQAVNYNGSHQSDAQSWSSHPVNGQCSTGLHQIAPPLPHTHTHTPADIFVTQSGVPSPKLLRHHDPGVLLATCFLQKCRS